MVTENYCTRIKVFLHFRSIRSNWMKEYLLPKAYICQGLTRCSKKPRYLSKFWKVSVIPIKSENNMQGRYRELFLPKRIALGLPRQRKIKQKLIIHIICHCGTPFLWELHIVKKFRMCFSKSFSTRGINFCIQGWYLNQTCQLQAARFFLFSMTISYIPFINLIPHKRLPNCMNKIIIT